MRKLKFLTFSNFYWFVIFKIFFGFFSNYHFPFHWTYSIKRSFYSQIIFAKYFPFRNITIRPNPIKDWFYFLFIISLLNSINYSILTLFFSFNLVLMSYLVNTFFTFLFYIIFVSVFKQYLKGLDD